MKFLVVRFAPGSGGKFLCTCLQASADVHPWESNLAKAKQDGTVLDYIKTKFTHNKVDWQKIEPEVPYQIQTFSSNRYPRGEDISFSKAQEYLKNDNTFQDHYKNAGRINVILNKSVVPKWLQRQSDIVNIHIDSKQSLRWYRVARITKMFVRKGNSYIIKQEHPAWLNPKRSENASKFNNKKVYTGTWHGFVRKYIINEELGLMFQNRQDIIKHKSNTEVTNHFYNLSTYGNTSLFIQNFNNLCDKLGIARVEYKLLVGMVKHYQSIH